MTDAELAEIKARHLPPVVPPCELCGAERTYILTREGRDYYGCSAAHNNRAPGMRRHFVESQYGTDAVCPDVPLLVAEVRRLTTHVKSLKREVEALRDENQSLESDKQYLENKYAECRMGEGV